MGRARTKSRYDDRTEVGPVVDYDSASPERYERERDLIASALGDLALGIEHVGSTAVPGLAAKPIIDIMVGVEQISDGRRCIGPLDEVGYEYRGTDDIPKHLFWRKGNPRLANFHMVERDSTFWRDHIAFRDALRVSSELAQQYGELKKRLAATYQKDKAGYNLAKEPFILGVLARDAVTLPEIIIVDYDPGWPEAFQQERARILAIWGGAIVSIEHIGSTAVPGLAAKPIIDIMVGIRELAEGERHVASLETEGYVYCGEAGVPGRLFFRKGNPRSHHLNIVQHEGSVWERTILFRDYLRRHQDAAGEYEKVKRGLAVRFRTDIPGYGAAKAPFVERVLAEARENENRTPDA